MSERKRKGNFSRELPAPHTAPGGAAEPCCASRVALKFLELVLVQRKVGNRLHKALRSAPGSPCMGKGTAGEAADSSSLEPAQSGPELPI